MILIPTLIHIYIKIPNYSWSPISVFRTIVPIVYTNWKSCYNNEIMLNIKVIIVTPATPPEIFYLPYLDSLFASQIKVLLIVVNLSNSSILLILSGTFLLSLGFYQYWLMLTRRQFLPDKIFGYVCPVGGRQDQHEATADVDQSRQLHPREGCTGGAVIGWNDFFYRLRSFFSFW